MTTRSPDPDTPRALDRILSFPLLEAVYRVASQPDPPAEKSELLTIALREFVTPADAANKMKKTVTRIWINPPSPAEPLIRWALENPHRFPDRRAMHVGALLATTPYVGSLIATLGRAFALREPAAIPELRVRMAASWGASSTVVSGVGKTVSTLRRLEVVEGGGRNPVTPLPALEISPMAAGWLVHAVMLHRRISSIEARDVLHAPELFWADVRKPDSKYPLLEMHREGLNRRVWVIR